MQNFVLRQSLHRGAASLLQVMLTKRTHIGGLRSLDANLLGEAHLLADAKEICNGTCIKLVLG